MASWWSSLLSNRLTDSSTCKPSLPIAHIVIVELHSLHTSKRKQILQNVMNSSKHNQSQEEVNSKRTYGKCQRKKQERSSKLCKIYNVKPMYYLQSLLPSSLYIFDRLRKLGYPGLCKKKRYFEHPTQPVPLWLCVATPLQLVIFLRAQCKPCA